MLVIGAVTYPRRQAPPYAHIRTHTIRNIPANANGRRRPEVGASAGHHYICPATPVLQPFRRYFVPVSPTDDEIDDAIMKVIKDLNLQPNMIFPIMPVHAKLQRAGLTADQINRGLERVQGRGWLKGSSGPHWTLTTEGHEQFGPPPSNDEVERAILDGIGANNPAADTVFPIVPIKAKLQQAGFSSQQINDALTNMVEKGWLKAGAGRHWTITTAGHAEI